MRPCGQVEPQRAAALAWAARFETLEDVVRRGLPIVDLIAQDEYTQDVVTESGGLYLVFDST